MSFFLFRVGVSWQTFIFAADKNWDVFFLLSGIVK